MDDLDFDPDTLEVCWRTDALISVYHLKQLSPPISHYQGTGKLVNAKGDGVALLRFSGDIALAWLLLEAQPFDIGLERELGTWTCSIPGAAASAHTAPLAICRAVLKLVKARRSAKTEGEG